MLLGGRESARLLLGDGTGAFSAEPLRVGQGISSRVGFWSGGTEGSFVWSVGNWTDTNEGKYQGSDFGVLRSQGTTPLASATLQDETGARLFSDIEHNVSAVVADFNEDGLADIAFSSALNKARGALPLYLGAGAGRVRAGGLLPWSGARQVYGADFNQDGHMDVLAMMDTRVLRVFLGDGQGGFAEASSVTLEREANDVAVVDLGPDAAPDVVALHGSVGLVSLLRGDGQGALVPHAQLRVGRAPSAAVTVDLDGNGSRELLVAEADDNAVSVYAIPDAPVLDSPGASLCPWGASPRPSLSPAIVQPLFDLSRAGPLSDLTSGDFDGDGRTDLALARRDSGIVLVSNPGDGTFPVQSIMDSYSVQQLRAGDFDGDGRGDLVAVMKRDNAPFTTSLLWNDAAKPFSTFLVLGDSAGEVLAADFNRDGRMDLAATLLERESSARSVRFTHLRQRSFRADTLWDRNPDPDAYHPGAGGLLAGDFDGDGLLDAVHQSLGINLNLTSADGRIRAGYGFLSVLSYRERFLGGVADVNGDGRTDLVYTSEDFGQVWLYPGDGRGSLGAPILCAPPLHNKTLTVEDLNGDGLVDIAGTSVEGTELWLSLGTGPGRWGPLQRYAAGDAIQKVWPVNLVGDARPELVVLSRSGQLRVFPTPEY